MTLRYALLGVLMLTGACAGPALDEVSVRPVPVATPEGPSRELIAGIGTRMDPEIIGASKSSLLGALGKPSLDHDYNFENCVFSEASWYVPGPGRTAKETIGEMSGTFLDAYFDANGRLALLRASGPGASTKDGLKVGRGLDAFTAANAGMTHIEAFLDFGLRTNSKVTTGYSVYLIDKSRGIAFELVQLCQTGQWEVDSISVFPPGTEFVRSYFCGVRENKFWLKLETLDLTTEVSKKLQENESEEEQSSTRCRSH